MEKEIYIPALGYSWLTRFYDPLVNLATRENTFKNALFEQAAIENSHTVLDLACGTATLAIKIKKCLPEVKIFALDADSKILSMARKKVAREQVEIYFEQAFSDALPFADSVFDRVVSTLFFHHLTLERKIKTLSEIRRVLKSGAEFHLADYALPRNKQQFVLSKWISLIDGFETTRDNLRGRLMPLMEESGFAKVERTGYFKTILGTIRLFKTIK